MSESERTTTEEPVVALDDEDQAWLAERLVEYRCLLDYLRDH